MSNGEYFYFDTDNDTYIGSPGDDTLDVWVGGVRVMRIFDDTLRLTYSIPIDTAVHMLGDIKTFSFGWGDGGDSTGMNAGIYLGNLPIVQDSIVFDSIRARVIGTDADVTFQLKYGTWGGSGTGIHTAEQLTASGGFETITTFSTLALGPPTDLWGEITAKSIAGTAIRVILYYHEKRAL